MSFAQLRVYSLIHMKGPGMADGQAGFTFLANHSLPVFCHELHQVPGGSRGETRLLAIVARFFSKKTELPRFAKCPDMSKHVKTLQMGTRSKWNSLRPRGSVRCRCHFHGVSTKRCHWCLWVLGLTWRMLWRSLPSSDIS